ncbi:MAG TPA: hypothetical protein VLF89_03480 [Candidatus Saccharimonadales bacterium]|nr:hypothetical protein [Candidatus Saccharimonadales bacterium]
MAYKFTCPLPGCSEVLISDAQETFDAQRELTEKAKQHLKEFHPELTKTDDEVNQDIKAHMVSGDN